MRPVPASGSAASRGASHSGADDLSPSSAIQPMTYFMTTEDALDRSDTRSFQPSYPYRSLPKNGVDSGSRNSRSHQQQQPSMSETASISWPSPSLASQKSVGTPHDLSRPMTPVLIDNFGIESAASSLSSPRSSSAASPSRNSSSMNLIRTPQSGASQGVLTGSNSDAAIPQFIMPSVPIPRRRPFSDTGKSLGKLKVLVAGPAGLGKSSLISSIAQSCKHIVHMDSMVAPQQGGVMEIYASTRPSPWWHAELEPSNLLPRRKSSATDEILDRNICFVDCSTDLQKLDAKHPAVGYVESQMSSLLTRSMGDRDLWKLLSSGAEPIVDVVLYLLPHTGPEPEDITIIKTLQSRTNILPILARADELENEVISRSQQQIKKLLESQDVDYFTFAFPGAEPAMTEIYSVSNISDTDDEIMDASVLMHSEYEPPLVATDLKRLVEDLLSPDGCARLRHAASLKCVTWRKQQNQGISAALTRRSSDGVGFPPPANIGNLSLQHQYWGRIEMGSWAENLRQSLAAERRGEAPLLLEPSRKIPDMPLTRIEEHRQHRRHGKSKRRDQIPQHQDPLGLLGLAGQLKCNSKQTIEVLSSVGVLGYLTAQLGGDVGILPKW